MPYTHLSADEIAKADADFKRKRRIADILKDLQKVRAQSASLLPQIAKYLQNARAQSGGTRPNR